MHCFTRKAEEYQISAAKNNHNMKLINHYKLVYQGCFLKYYEHNLQRVIKYEYLKITKSVVAHGYYMIHIQYMTKILVAVISPGDYFIIH